MTWISGAPCDARAMRGVYRFEGISDALELVPLAARRALDAAGRKVGLEAWRAMPLAARASIVEAGAAAQVDVRAVRDALEAVDATPIEAVAEPDPVTPPTSVVALGVSAARWASMGALDRWALASLARRGKDESAGALLAELV
jgi:hypothetical protein